MGLQLALKDIAGPSASLLIFVLIYSNLSVRWVLLKKQFVWHGVAIKKASLTDSILVTEKKTLCITRRMGPVGLLDSTCIITALILYLYSFTSVSWSIMTKLKL